MKRRIVKCVLTMILVTVMFLGQVPLAVNAADGTYPEAKPLPTLTGNCLDDFIAVALSQEGYKAADDNDTVYWNWAGSRGSTKSWCSEFAAWCAHYANVPESIFPTRWSSTGYREYFSGKGQYYNIEGGCEVNGCNDCKSLAAATISPYDIKRGDILLVESNNPSNYSNGPDHTCIAWKIEGDYLYAIEGNIKLSDGSHVVYINKRYLKKDPLPFHGVCRPAYPKTDPVVTAPAIETNLVFSGDPLSLVSSGSVKGGTLYYAVSDDLAKTLADSDYLKAIPSAVNAGTYYVYYKVEGDDSHNDVAPEGPLAVTISRANASITAHPAKASEGLTENGKTQSLITAGTASGGDLVYAVTTENSAPADSSYAQTIPAATDAGTYYVYYQVKGDSNHYDSAVAGPITVTISKQVTPNPEPEPDPEPTPTPDPTPTPTPEQDPTPTSTSEPDPTPTPTLEPDPTPTPTPEPDSTPTPTPEPNPTPTPVPAPTPSPEPDPEPSPTPAPSLDPVTDTEPTVTPTPASKKVGNIKLGKTKANLTVGKKLTLKATVTPSDAANKGLTWKSSNTGIATVNSNGVVTGKKPGKVTITVKAKDGSQKTAKCTVTVKAVKVKSVSLNKKTVGLKEGKTLKLKVTIAPKNATNKNVVWKSSNKKVVTVDKNGKVKAVKKGKATITVTTRDGKKTAQCKITVK